MVLDREMTSSQAKLAVEDGVEVKRRKPKVVNRNLVVIVIVLALLALSLFVATGTELFYFLLLLWMQNV